MKGEPMNTNPLPRKRYTVAVAVKASKDGYHALAQFKTCTDATGFADHKALVFGEGISVVVYDHRQAIVYVASVN